MKTMWFNYGDCICVGTDETEVIVFLPHDSVAALEVKSGRISQEILDRLSRTYTYRENDKMCPHSSVD